MTEIGNWKMKRKKLILCILGILCMVITSCGTKENKQEQEEYTGIPDVVNSVTIGNDYDLILVANSEKIEDREEFARKVIHMCQDNAFHSVKFSTDIRGYPAGLDISVYLNREDIKERKEPICKVEFKTDDFSKGYNIVNDEDKFSLYLDEKEIEFY